jgi:succinyl-diaminopimelate desuccinylase
LHAIPGFPSPRPFAMLARWTGQRRIHRPQHPRAPGAPQAPGRVPTVNPPGENYEAVTGYLTRELARIGLSAQAASRSREAPEEPACPRRSTGSRATTCSASSRSRRSQDDPFQRPLRRRPRLRDLAPREPVQRGRREGRDLRPRDRRHEGLDREPADRARTPCAPRGRAPKMNIEVSFTADEETDSFLGARWVVDEAPIRPDYAIVMEGAEGDEVCCGHNGTLWLEVTVHGRAAHGSTPQDGVNALEKMAALVARARGLQGKIARTDLPHARGQDDAPDDQRGGRLRRAAPAPRSTRFPRTGLVLDRPPRPAGGGPRGGRARPARLPGGGGAADPGVQDQRLEGLRELLVLHEADHPFFKAMASSVGRVRAGPTVFHVSTGFNDIHYFAQHLKIPTLGYGPGRRRHPRGGRAGAHQGPPVASAKIYADLLTTFAG